MAVMSGERALWSEEITSRKSIWIACEKTTVSEDQERASMAAEWTQQVGGDRAHGERTWKVVHVLWLRKWH